jgi:hypothetical protein
METNVLTNFQKIALAMLAICMVAICAIAYTVMKGPALTHEQKLTAACEQHPDECETMRIVHATTENAVRQAEAAGPSMANAIASLKKTQMDYDLRFIKEGYYGDEKPEKQH